MSKHIEFDLQVNASYKPLSKLIVDNDKLKKASRDDAYLSSASSTRLNNTDALTIDAILHSRQALDCQIGDMVHVIPTNELREQSA